MFDHFTQIAATQDMLVHEQDDFSAFGSLSSPPAQLEYLPEGLIEDQV